MKKRYFLSIKKAATIFTFLLILLCGGCKKILEADPPPTISGATVFDNDLTAIASVSGLYVLIGTQTLTNPINFVSLAKLGGLSADELTLRNSSSALQVSYYKNSLLATTSFSAGTELWNNIYSLIFNCNNIIPGISSSTKLSPAVQKQLLGEAKFMRALFYFYLVNLYGDVPLVLTTDYEKNRLLARTPKSQVYAQIISDLQDAKDKLSADFLDGYLNRYPGAFERLRPTKWAASALLSRVYLYQASLGDNSAWARAETEASIVINQSNLFTLTNVNSVFLMNSNEAIFQLQPVIANQNTSLAINFILTTSGINSTRNCTINDTLLNSFEANDARRTAWIGNVVAGGGTLYFPYKYKANAGAALTEYLMVLRLAEQYLIRGEARAQQGKLSEAIDDLDKIRGRANLPLIANTNPSISQSQLLTAFQHERQVELFTEWGDRWLNLKRTNTVDALMTGITPLKGGTWKSYQQLYPIPLGDLEKNINLVQNPNY